MSPSTHDQGSLMETFDVLNQQSQPRTTFVFECLFIAFNLFIIQGNQVEIFCYILILGIATFYFIFYDEDIPWYLPDKINSGGMQTTNAHVAQVNEGDKN